MIYLDIDTGARFKVPQLPHPHRIENGGYLIGRPIKDTLDYVVDCFTDVHPGDVATENSLVIEDPYHQWKINREWELNGGSCLGHWHTHHERYPHPSEIDLAGWKKLAEEVYGSSGGSPFLCVIQGIVHTRAWVQFPEALGGKLRELDHSAKMAFAG